MYASPPSRTTAPSAGSSAITAIDREAGCGYAPDQPGGSEPADGTPAGGQVCGAITLGRCSDPGATFPGARTDAGGECGTIAAASARVGGGVAMALLGKIRAVTATNTPTRAKVRWVCGRPIGH